MYLVTTTSTRAYPCITELEYYTLVKILDVCSRNYWNQGRIYIGAVAPAKFGSTRVFPLVWRIFELGRRHLVVAMAVAMFSRWGESEMEVEEGGSTNWALGL
jgi:hypothetical protein